MKSARIVVPGVLGALALLGCGEDPGVQARSGSAAGDPGTGGGGSSSNTSGAGSSSNAGGRGRHLERGACGLDAPAFCDDFEKKSPGGRAGDLDERLWSFARWGVDGDNTIDVENIDLEALAAIANMDLTIDVEN